MRVKNTLRRLARAIGRRNSGKPDQSHTTLPADSANSIRYFANAGPAFESRTTPDHPAENTHVKAVAFYLPQFHAFPENDSWWGDGFTEWRNVSRGTPRYQGHYQPRIPRDLGFYDLNDANVIKAQAALARSAGIKAFCFYYYWFNGKRLMDKPLDIYANSDIDQEFCIMWANENWTRRWDGREQDVLIAQDYIDTDEQAFLEDTAAYMAHSRYMRVGERPLFILYRASLIPDTKATITRWRKRWTTLLGVEPLIFMVQSYDDRDPKPFGMDGAIEFPPHKVSRDIGRRNHEHTMFDPDYSGQVRAYQDVVNKSLNEPAPHYPLIKTVSPSWDNDARREGRGVTFQGSTPSAYANWLGGAVQFAQKHPIANDESFVFINAWNEWAEAAYLEPDVHYGHAYLNTTYRTLTQAQHSNPHTELLLVGHDAHANGAQLLLLSLARLFTQDLGLSVRIVLKKSGALLQQYEAVAPVTVFENFSTDEQQQWFKDHSCKTALFNTSVTGDLIPYAKMANMHCVSLVHEMPALIIDYQLQPHLNAIAQHANHIVFPSTKVMQGFRSFEPNIKGQTSIKPQGLYKSIQAAPDARQTKRHQLNIADDAKLVINLGYADQRKGFDLFIEAALRAQQQNPEIHFCWLGKRRKDMSRWLKKTAGNALSERLHLIDFTDDVTPWYAAADCLYLSSREDPFPSVVLEAMSIGLPVVAHKNSTGFDESLLALVYQAELSDPSSVDEALTQALFADDATLPHARAEHMQENYQLKQYGDVLIQLNTDQQAGSF